MCGLQIFASAIVNSQHRPSNSAVVFNVHLFAPANLPPHPPFFVKKIMRKAKIFFVWSGQGLLQRLNHPAGTEKIPRLPRNAWVNRLPGIAYICETWGKIVRSWVEVASVGVRLLLFITCSLQCFFPEIPAG